jgi:hypothetical protein
MTPRSMVMKETSHPFASSSRRPTGSDPPVAIGRKAYLFPGSDEAARRLAVLQSIVVLCELTKAPMFEYNFTRRSPSFPAKPTTRWTCIPDGAIN